MNYEREGEKGKSIALSVDGVARRVSFDLMVSNKWGSNML